jgi:glycosyltransferase involved in cell wall biosynthesis
MDKLKVIHIITMLELGGAQQNTIYTVTHLNTERFYPVLISGKGGLLDETVRNLSIKKYFVTYLKRKINPIFDVLALFNILIILFKENPDIVHTHSSKAGILGRWAAFLVKILKLLFFTTRRIKKMRPLIIHTFHGFGFNDYQNMITKNLFILIEQITEKITDKFIAVSEQNIDTGINNRIGLRNKYVLIRSGVKIKDFSEVKIDKGLKKRELGIKDNDRVVTTIGPFKPQKNLSDYIELANLVLMKISNVKFIIIGDGEQRNLLLNRVKQLKLENNILFLGWRKDIPELLAITDIFVMTSLWEGLPRSIVEAMLSEKPVIAYSVDGVKEIVKDNVTGFLINPKNIKLMSEKLLFLLNNTDLIYKFGKMAKTTIDISFDIDYMVKQQESLYEKLYYG